MASCLQGSNSRNGWSFDHPGNIRLLITKETGQSHTVRSTDPDTWTEKVLLSQNLPLKFYTAKTVM